MAAPSSKEVTQLLVDWTDGNKAALDRLDDALTSLTTFDARKSQIVELRFFGGLNIDETAEVMKISTRTVEREWQWAKAYLRREITRNDSDDTRTLAEDH